MGFAAPAVAFEVAPPLAEPSPLRSDVASFLGATRRGPLGAPVRVEEWREYMRLFGGLDQAADTSYAVRSYFENGGQVAYVTRLAGDGVKTAEGQWPEAAPDPLPTFEAAPDPLPTFEAFRRGTKAIGHFALRASSSGEWANGVKVKVRYRSCGETGAAEVDFDVQIAGVVKERLRSLQAVNADALAEAVAERSTYLRLVPLDSSEGPPAVEAGPARLEWRSTLKHGKDDPPTRTGYLEALSEVGLETEVALIAMPDLRRHLSTANAAEVLRSAVAEADRRLDRLVLVDLPAEAVSIDEVLLAADELGAAGSVVPWRSAAAYHPHLKVPDPLSGSANLVRRIPPSGTVAGLISRLDRERGAHYTPANAPLYGVVDLTASFDEIGRGRLNQRGVNVIRCFAGRGLKVWGGRTLEPCPLGRFVAHRRLIHRLVRAIRRVAEPLVFETNGPELWLAFVRAITSVLLEAFRAGALQGARPEEAFNVQCDEETNPPEEVELGRVVCEIEVAPAVPMEFIKLRVALGREGELEVFEP